VKTLLPKIHGGILARRDVPAHLEQLERAEIAPIDVVVVNLYPFTRYLETEKATDPAAMIELIDVGGPTMIRAAAKNHPFVLPVSDPADYLEVISLLSASGAGADPFPADVRRRYAAKVFETLSAYDGAIGSYIAGLDSAGAASSGGFPERASLELTKVADLRYGENPHQKAAFYAPSARGRLEPLAGPTWTQLGGKELSYNNMLDLDAALRLLADLPTGKAVVGILKHLNPCGVASGRDLADAVQRAKLCDPRSHFGGVLVLNQKVDETAAEEIREDFAELVIAPGFEPAALKILATSKNLRILEVLPKSMSGYEVRSVLGGFLVQDPDIDRTHTSHAQLVSERVPTDEELEDLELAWRLVGHVKSNAIVLVRDGLLVGVGAGQMSRIDSVEVAIQKAKLHGHVLDGAVAASDAFFPFPDSVETLAKEGIRCIVSPAGARRDDETKATAVKHGVSLFFASDRHFRH
jgi:phosphoribosylaminoimidazolecarboxamide formyltransferase/IMP cyclohydrolase